MEYGFVIRETNFLCDSVSYDMTTEVLRFVCLFVCFVRTPTRPRMGASGSVGFYTTCLLFTGAMGHDCRTSMTLSSQRPFASVPLCPSMPGPEVWLMMKATARGRSLLSVDLIPIVPVLSLSVFLRCHCLTCFCGSLQYICLSLHPSGYSVSGYPSSSPSASPESLSPWGSFNCLNCINSPVASRNLEVYLGLSLAYLHFPTSPP